MPILYDSKLSGNGWKIRLLLSFLGMSFERKVLNLAEGEAKTLEFRQLNPLGRVPVLVLDDGTPLIESNSILIHLARNTAWLPSSPREEARVLQWLFFEQYDHLRYFARPRFLVSIAKVAEQSADELAYLRQIGLRALVALETQLSCTPFLTGGHCTIADVALFPYTSMAEMGGYDLQPHPGVREWIGRMQSLPGFIPLIAHAP